MTDFSSSVVFILIGVAVWGGEVHNSDALDIGYSFALSIVGGLFILIGGILAFMGGNQKY